MDFDKMDPVLKALVEPIILGGTPIPGTPEDFGKLISNDTQKWERVVKSSGATVD